MNFAVQRFSLNSPVGAGLIPARAHLFSLFLLFLPCLLIACDSSEQLRSYCTSDLDCEAGYRCDIGTGLCLCATDDVCGPEEYCAPDGQCRRRMSCDSNLDCPEDTFCDSTTGNCIEVGKCTDDKQCPLGQICSESYFRCVPGCRQSGDCTLGEICRDDNCIEGCEDTSGCAYGQLCDPINETCIDDDRGPYCERCSSATIYSPHQCDDGPNYCLIAEGNLTLPPYCGVDCGQGQPCPNGYDCFSVRLVYTRDNCESDAECSSGSCFIKEGDEKGFCLCTADDQCPDDVCEDDRLECRYTRRPCTPGGNECDRPIYCIEGFCHIGYNCKPKEGLRCGDLLP